MKLSTTLSAFGCSLLLVGTAEAGKTWNKAVAPKKTPKIVPYPYSLKIRGGAGPLDPTQTAKVTLALELAQGLLSTKAPSLTNEKYGFSANPLNDWTLEAFGTTVVSNCILVYCTLCKNTSLGAAVQLSLIPWILYNLGNVLNKTASSLNFNDDGQIFSLLLNSFWVFAATQDWAMKAFKCFVAWYAINGIFLVASPDNGVKAWAKDGLTITGDTLGLFRAFGFSLLAYAVFLGSMIFYDNTALTAFGHLEIVWLAYHVLSQFIFGDFKKYGIQEGPMMVWALLHMVVIATILF